MAIARIFFGKNSFPGDWLLYHLDLIRSPKYYVEILDGIIPIANGFGLHTGISVLFANGTALAHQAQVYTGPGWAIAKLNIPFLEAVKKIVRPFYFRIADGCGYYDGTFWYRQKVINGEWPVYLPIVAIPMYDQGIGRSIWYLEKSDMHKACSKIETFASSRHADLWRGIGTALAYVGGCTDEGLKMLMQLSATNGIQPGCACGQVADEGKHMDS